MALIFPRLARNFAKNGYYPTDEPTLERALNALAPAAGQVAIIDPCAGKALPSPKLRMRLAVIWCLLMPSNSTKSAPDMPEGLSTIACTAT